MSNPYNELIEKGIQFQQEYKFYEAFDTFKEAKELNSKSAQAYIEAAKTCYLTKQYKSSVALHVVGVLLLSKLPINPSTITSHYYDNAQHIANGLIIEDESLQSQIMDFLEITKEQFDLATDVYKYSLLGKVGQAYFDTYKKQLTAEIYNKYQDVLVKVGLHYINNIISNNLSKEHIIKHFTKNLNW